MNNTKTWQMHALVAAIGLGLVGCGREGGGGNRSSTSSDQVVSVDARIYRSEPKAIFCTTKLSAKNFQRFMEQNDAAAAGNVIQSGDCSVVTPSLELFIDSEEAGIVGVRRKGLPDVVWTFKHMLS